MALDVNKVVETTLEGAPSFACSEVLLRAQSPLAEKQREKLAKLQGIEKPKTTKPKKKDLLVVGEEAPAFEKQMSDSLGSYYERLMKKHGTDYAVRIHRSAFLYLPERSRQALLTDPQAMARDIKLNTWQHTKRKLQKECERLISQRERRAAQGL